MALQMDLDQKPTPGAWLAQDAWFDGLMRDVHRAFADAYREARGQAERRLGTPADGKKGA